MTIRGNVHRTQELENSAAEKIGIRTLFLDEARLFRIDRDAYIKDFIGQILEEIAPELKESAALGVTLAKMIKGAGR